MASATSLPELSRADWMRHIASLPRTRRTASSKLQAKYAGALAHLASQGIRFAKPDQRLYLMGYQAGIKAALSWSSLEPKPAKQPKARNPAK